MKENENEGIERNSMDPMEKKEIKRKLGGVGRIKKDKRLKVNAHFLK